MPRSRNVQKHKCPRLEEQERLFVEIISQIKTFLYSQAAQEQLSLFNHGRAAGRKS